MVNFFVALFDVCLCWFMSCFIGLLLASSILPPANAPANELVPLGECLIYVAIGWGVFNHGVLEKEYQKTFNIMMTILYVFALLCI